MKRRPALLVVVATTLVLVAAGCGGDENGSSDDRTDPGRWAAGFCDAITAFSTNISESGKALQGDGLPSGDDVVEAVRTAAAAAGTLADDFRGLGAPDVPDGEEIQAALENAADDARETFASVEGDIGGPIEDASDVAVQAGKIAEAAQKALAGLGEATDRMQALAGGTLEDALEAASECAEIDTTSG